MKKKTKVVVWLIWSEKKGKKMINLKGINHPTTFPKEKWVKHGTLISSWSCIFPTLSNMHLLLG